jgi:hypothetical protein
MTLLNEGSHFSDAKKQKTEPIYKKLKVVNKHYLKTYVPGFNIQGKYLEKYGFSYGDFVDVIVSENRILIEKVIN